MNKSDAEKAIRGILRQLEQDTGRVVDGLYMKVIDTSTMCEESKLMAVEITLSMPPGEAWV